MSVFCPCLYEESRVLVPGYPLIHPIFCRFAIYSIFLANEYDPKKWLLRFVFSSFARFVIVVLVLSVFF